MHRLIVLPEKFECQTNNLGHIFCEVFVSYQTFLSPQVKRNMIIGSKNGILVPNDFRLRSLRN